MVPIDTNHLTPTLTLTILSCTPHVHRYPHKSKRIQYTILWLIVKKDDHCRLYSLHRLLTEERLTPKNSAILF